MGSLVAALLGGGLSPTLGIHMARTPNEALEWFRSLSQAKRAHFLAALSFNLTIAARCFFDAFHPENTDAIRARQINEILHRVTSYLHYIHIDDEDIMWAPVITKAILEEADPIVQEQIMQAWFYAERSVNA